MIPIVWKEYTCTVSGGVFKVVECENCKQKYVYHMVRQAQGQGKSMYLVDNEGAGSRARQEAQATLAAQLERDCDPIPCVKCGWYQASMVAKLRGEHSPWLFWLGVGLLFCTVLVAVVAWLAYAAMGAPDEIAVAALGGILGFWALGMAAFVVRSKLAQRFDPNAAPVAERVRAAQGRAETLEDFEKWLKDQCLA
jgi:hypothetical protein